MRDYIRPGPYRVGRRLIGRTPRRSHTFSRDTCLAAELDRKAPAVLNQCSRRDAELAVVDDRVPGGMRNPEWRRWPNPRDPDDYLSMVLRPMS